MCRLELLAIRCACNDDDDDAIAVVVSFSLCFCFYFFSFFFLSRFLALEIIYMYNELNIESIEYEYRYVSMMMDENDCSKVLDEHHRHMKNILCKTDDERTNEWTEDQLAISVEMKSKGGINNDTCIIQYIYIFYREWWKYCRAMTCKSVHYISAHALHNIFTCITFKELKFFNIMHFPSNSFLKKKT